MANPHRLVPDRNVGGRRLIAWADAQPPPTTTTTYCYPEDNGCEPDVPAQVQIFLATGAAKILRLLSSSPICGYYGSGGLVDAGGYLEICTQSGQDAVFDTADEVFVPSDHPLCGGVLSWAIAR